MREERIRTPAWCYIFGQGQEFKGRGVDGRRMGGESPPVQDLVLLQFLQAVKGPFHVNGWTVGQDPKYLRKVLNQFLAADAAAGLADKAPPLQHGGYRRQPGLGDGESHHVGGLSLTRTDCFYVIRAVQDSLRQGKTGYMGRFVSGGAHDHGIGLALDPDGQGLFPDKIQPDGTLLSSIPEQDRQRGSVIAQGSSLGRCGEENVIYYNRHAIPAVP
jgi:hypothetical protein